MSTLVATEVGLSLPGFTLSPTGLTVDGNPSYEVWAAAYESVKRVDSALRWWVGDLLNIGNERFGDAWTQVLTAVEWEKGTFANTKSVAKLVPHSRRRESLSFDHHAAVSSLEPDAQESFLSLAERDGMTRQELTDTVQRYKRENGMAPPYDIERDIKRFRDLFDRLKPNWDEKHKGRMHQLFQELAEEV